MKGIVSFYEKPGCKGNAKQKEILRQAGYKLQVIDILSKEWDEETLMKFIGNMPVHACVNVKAPSVKSGIFEPEKLTEAELVEAMIYEPILIKRPLVFYRGEFAVGFDSDLVEKLLNQRMEDSVCFSTKENMCP